MDRNFRVCCLCLSILDGCLGMGSVGGAEAIVDVSAELKPLQSSPSSPENGCVGMAVVVVVVVVGVVSAELKSVQSANGSSFL